MSAARRLHVLATHLGLRIHERRFQVRQILDYLDSVRDTSVVVLGDFNDWLPGRSAAHVLDRRLGRPPRPATFPVVVAARGAGSHLGSTQTLRFDGSPSTRLRPPGSRRITFPWWQRSTPIDGSFKPERPRSELRTSSHRHEPCTSPMKYRAHRADDTCVRYRNAASTRSHG